MENVIANIKQIRKDKGFTQAFMASELGFDTSNWSKIESGKQKLNTDKLGEIAQLFNLRIIDLFTYPDKYVLQEYKNAASEKVSVTFEIPIENRNILLELVKNSTPK